MLVADGLTRLPVFTFVPYSCCYSVLLRLHCGTCGETCVHMHFIIAHARTRERERERERASSRTSLKVEDVGLGSGSRFRSLVAMVGPRV